MQAIAGVLMVAIIIRLEIGFDGINKRTMMNGRMEVKSEGG
jgi:hypothetical protein